MKLISSHKDEKENVLIIEENRSKNLNLYIKLENERHRRHIGLINIKSRIMHVERNSTQHILKKANAYGFNHYILSKGQKFDKVALHEIDTGKIYLIDKNYLLKEGQFLFFKQQGFEKQLFLTKEWLDYYEVSCEKEKKLLLGEYKINV